MPNLNREYSDYLQQMNARYQELIDPITFFEPQGTNVSPGQVIEFTNHTLRQWSTRQGDNVTDESELQQKRRLEKEALELFIEKGTLNGTCEMYIDEAGKIRMTGFNMSGTPTLFTMTDTTITAKASRTRHVKSLLEELAKRESKELKFIQRVPAALTNPQRVAYYAFDNWEIDDTELVSATTTRFIEPRDNTREQRNEHIRWELDDYVPF